MGSCPGRPVKTHGPPHGPGGAAHIEPTSHGPRSGPAHQISTGWAAARPGPSSFHRVVRSLARPIQSSEDGPRPGPAHHILKKSRPGPARPINFSKVPPGPARPITFSRVSARPCPSQFSDRPGPARPRQTAHDKP